MVEVILKAQNLSKRFGDKHVLRNIDLDIHAGEIFGIIGSSGSGKTTLLNSLIGFVAPTKGEVLFRDPHLLSYRAAGEARSAFRNVLHYSTEVKRIFGFAAQDPSVYAKLTVSENIKLFGSLYDLSRDARHTNANILLKLMGLYNSRHLYAKNLSGGMVKRLDIACALIHDPKILILDEPTADLDPYLRRHMWELIRQINQKGTTIIISSHYLDEIEQLCDRIGVMHNGVIQHYGTPAQVKKMEDGSEEIHVRTQYRRYDVLMKKLKGSGLKMSDMRNVGPELLVKSSKPLEIVQYIVRVTQKIEDPIIDLRLNKPSLNDIFATFVEGFQGGDLAKHQAKIEAELEEEKKKRLFYRLFRKLVPQKVFMRDDAKSKLSNHVKKTDLKPREARGGARRASSIGTSKRASRAVRKKPLFGLFAKREEKRNKPARKLRTPPKKVYKKEKPMKARKRSGKGVAKPSSGLLGGLFSRKAATPPQRNLQKPAKKLPSKPKRKTQQVPVKNPQVKGVSTGLFGGLFAKKSESALSQKKRERPVLPKRTAKKAPPRKPMRKLQMPQLLRKQKQEKQKRQEVTLDDIAALRKRIKRLQK